MNTLTKKQNELMQKFYAKEQTKVVYKKSVRNKIWSIVKTKQNFDELDVIKQQCPAMAHQITKSYESGNNIQSAVFSECVYAQTLANIFNLNIFNNCFENKNFLSQKVKELLNSYNLFPRYVYSNAEESLMLVQAGGCKGIDSALISLDTLDVYTIEFKESSAKTGEHDLPKFQEDGNLLVTDEFVSNYPQFKQMLNEQKEFNFFNKMGSNERNFSFESINIAVTENNSNKCADVVCTEDSSGYLVMLPSNQLSMWAAIEGEIRTAGRNNHSVWTPNALTELILQKGGKIDNDIVTMDKGQLNFRKKRGGDGSISGYKINPMFFVYKNKCIEKENLVTFNLNAVKQLNPTIAAKVFFKKLKHKNVKEFYFPNN